MSFAFGCYNSFFIGSVHILNWKIDKIVYTPSIYPPYEVLLEGSINQLYIWVFCKRPCAYNIGKYPRYVELLPSLFYLFLRPVPVLVTFFCISSIKRNSSSRAVAMNADNNNS